jgi:hypothetical protein
MGHALGADRLLIRPASGRQAGTGFLARTNRSKDTRQGHPLTESQTKNTGTNLTNAPDGTPAESQSSHLTRAAERGAAATHSVRAARFLSAIPVSGTIPKRL